MKWIEFIFENDFSKYLRFVEYHMKENTWTDSDGLICQATALLVGRQINLIGTANIGSKEHFTKLESVQEANTLPPMNIAYYQNKYFQSLQMIDINDVLDKNKTLEDEDLNKTEDKTNQDDDKVLKKIEKPGKAKVVIKIIKR